MQGLTPGRMIHFVLPEHSRDPGRHCPAVVTMVHSDDGMINAQVFTDFENDFNKPDEGSDGRYWATSIEFDDQEKLPNTWHWIEQA